MQTPPSRSSRSCARSFSRWTNSPASSASLAENHQRPRCHGARQWLRNAHDADVRVDGAIERQVFGERVDEHQRVVDVRTNDRFLGPRLREANAAFGGRVELPREQRFGKQPSEHMGPWLGENDWASNVACDVP